MPTISTRVNSCFVYAGIRSNEEGCFSGNWCCLFFGFFFACLAGLVMLRLTPGIGIGINKGFGVLSLFSFSWATLGRLGWEGQTCDGGTIFEKLDSDIFWFLYFMGTMFGAVSIMANY